MKYNKLGNTSIEISPLCFGTLTISPTQKNFHPSKAAELICQAYDLGVNFFDTAELYDTYEPLAIALQSHPELVITSKSYAVTFAEMRQSIELARQKLNRDYIDIFALHEVETMASLKGHQGALEYLEEAKSKGIIKAIGISTHTVAGVRAGATDPRIEVIHPLLNQSGIGIKDGTVNDMIEAIMTAREFSKGIYAMKVLGGGHLSGDAATAIHFVTNLHCTDSIAIGIQSLAELKLNLHLIHNEEVPDILAAEVSRIERFLEIAAWCQGCGRCVAKCSFGALIMDNGKPKVLQDKCVRCSYCARVCPEFCIKVV
jgi:aryl-alcohol dehydrogenase-like predicted oxidoreductase/ferredoxin